MKRLVAALFLVLVSAGFGIGAEPVTTAGPYDQTILSERLDEVNDILKENELAGKKAKTYCENDWNTWVIVIKHGKITGTFTTKSGPGEYPVTGTKKGKTINMITTGGCDIYCNITHEVTVTKTGKGVFEGIFRIKSCPGWGDLCDGEGPAVLVKGSCS